LATRVFAEEEPERLGEFPEIGRDELFRNFTLTRPTSRPLGSSFTAAARRPAPTTCVGGTYEEIVFANSAAAPTSRLRPSSRQRSTRD
jgi:hypothetical protein